MAADRSQAPVGEGRAVGSGLTWCSMPDRPGAPSAPASVPDPGQRCRLRELGRTDGFILDP